MFVRQSPYDYMMTGRDVDTGRPVGLRLIPGYKVMTLRMESLRPSNLS